MKTKTPELKFRPYGNRIHEPAAQLSMVHHRGAQIHREMYPESRSGGRGAHRPMTQSSPVCYSKYAAMTTGLPEQYIRDLVRVGKCVPEEFLVSIMGTDLDNFMYLLRIARLTEDHLNETK